jgi:YVTN family beta-propeller protein
MSQPFRSRLGHECTLLRALKLKSCRALAPRFLAELVLVLGCFLLPPALPAQTVIATIPANLGGPTAVNVVTNTIYVGNLNQGTALSTVSVFDGTTKTLIATVPVGSQPWAIAVNPTTNLVYVANASSASVSVIDGTTNTVTATVPVDVAPWAIAVNPVTNKIYTANCGFDCDATAGIGTVSVIDGATNAATAPITVGINPRAISINPVTNMVYVMNCACEAGPGSVTVINGATDTIVATIPQGLYPEPAAVNPATNTLFVADSQSDDVSVIDGSTNAVIATVATGTGTSEVVVSPVTNTAYLPNYDSNNATIINGATLTSTSIPTGVNAISVGLDPTTNTVYVFNEDVPNREQSATITVIDGASNTAVANVLLTAYFSVIGVNPVTHTVYGGSAGSACPPACSLTAIDESTNSTVAVAGGTSPTAVAVNPATNTIYLANGGSGEVTVINGTNNAVTTTVSVGTTPVAVAVNPVTNTAFVANSGSGNLTVIDGSSNSVTTTVATGTTPTAVAVDPTSNTVFVANGGANSVSVIDGASGAVRGAAAVGADPVAIAVNPANHLAYSANAGDGSVSVINGVTGTATATVGAGTDPVAVAVNPTTNTVYVANQGSSNVTIINGATLSAAATVAVGSSPVSVAVNPLTNIVYVANQGSSTLSVINGATNTVTATLATGTNPTGVAVDPVNNKVYITNGGSANITVIDGSTNTIEAPATAGTDPVALVVNPATDNVYVANNGSSNATVLTPIPISAVPLTSVVQGVADSQTVSGTAVFATTNPNPSFTTTVTSSYSPISPPPTVMYYQLDTVQGPWQAATMTTVAGANPASFSFQISGVSLGTHIVFAYAAYGAEGTPDSAQEITGNSPEIGNVSAYVFAEVSPLASSSMTLTSSLNPSVLGQSVTFTATLSPASGPTGTIAFTSNGSTIDGCGAGVLSSGVATCATDSLPVGTDTIVATYSGDNDYAGSSATLAQVVTAAGGGGGSGSGSFTVAATPASQEVQGGSTATYTVTVTSESGFAGVVALTCSGQPQDGACSFSKGNLTLAVSGSAQTTMTVTTVKSDAALRPIAGGPTNEPAEGSSAETSPLTAQPLSLTVSTFSALTLLLLRRRKAPWAQKARLGLALTLVMTVMNGCAGCHNQRPTSNTYKLTISGTSGTLTGSTTVMLDVESK